MEQKETTIENEATKSTTAVNNNADLITDLKAFVVYLESRPGLTKIDSVSAPIFTWSKESFVDALLIAHSRN
jgi:hypothetical protein